MTAESGDGKDQDAPGHREAHHGYGAWEADPRAANGRALQSREITSAAALAETRGGRPRRLPPEDRSAIAVQIRSQCGFRIADCGLTSGSATRNLQSAIRNVALRGGMARVKLEVTVRRLHKKILK